MTIEPTKTPQTGLGQWDAIAERNDVALWEKSDLGPRALCKQAAYSTIDTAANFSKKLAGDAIDTLADTSTAVSVHSYSLLSILSFFKKK